MNEPYIITEEEAAALEMAYGKALAHLERAKAELEKAKKNDPLGVIFAQIDARSVEDSLYMAWHRILRKHPLIGKLFEAEPQGVDYFMWNIGLSPNVPPIEEKIILWAFGEIEKRKNSIEEQINRILSLPQEEPPDEWRSQICP